MKSEGESEERESIGSQKILRAAVATPPPLIVFPNRKQKNMVAFPALTSAEGLKALDAHLATRSYVEG